MEYYIPPPQTKTPDFMSTMQGFAGLAQMADQAEQAPVNLATSKANLEAIQQGIAQRKLTDPVQLATSQKNLDILNQSYKHNEILHPLQVRNYEQLVQQGLLNVEDLKRQAEAQKKAQQSLDDAILENQTNPSGKNAEKLNIAAAARNPQAWATMASSVANADERTRRIAFDTSFDTWAALASGSPDDAKTVLQTSIDAANNAGRKDLAIKFQSDLKMLDTDPTGNSLLTKASMIAANSPQHKTAMDMYAKGITLPPSVARDVKKELDQVTSLEGLRTELSDLQSKWEKMPEPPAPGAIGNIEKAINYVGQKGKEAFPAFRTEEDNLRLLTDSYFNLDRLKQFKDAMGSMGIRNLKEFETALGGKVSVYADKDQVINRIHAIKELIGGLAGIKEASANWISTFKGSSIATKNGMITGIPIEKGTTIKEFEKEYQKQYIQNLFEQNFNQLRTPMGNVDAQGNSVAAPAENAPAVSAGKIFRVISPDGKLLQGTKEQIEAYKKDNPGARDQ